MVYGWHGGRKIRLTASVEAGFGDEENRDEDERKRSEGEEVPRFQRGLKVENGP